MVLSQLYRSVILLFVAGIVLFLVFKPLGESRFGPQSDEGYYLRYSSAVVHKGHKVFKNLISWYASSAEARKHPAPVRAGYILLGAFLFKWTGHPSFSVLGLVSMVSFLFFLLLCFYYVRKYFDLDTALMTLLLLASSPLMLGLSRRALIDSPANFLWAGAFWLFLDVLLKPKRWSYVCFLVFLCVAVTFKESTLVLIPFYVMAAMEARRKGADIKVYQIWGILICPLVFISLFYGWIFGGLGVLKTAFVAIAKTHFSSDQPNPYAVNYCSGPWFKYILDFLLLIPIETILFLGYAGYLCIQRPLLDLKRTYCLMYFVYVYAVLSSLAHTKVVRFVVNLEMVIALFSVLMLVEIFKGLELQKGQRWLMYAIVGIFLTNWLSFGDLFYATSLLDPISYHLLHFRNFIP